MATPELNGDGLSQIILALEATYDPRSNNETRQAALQFLEAAKKQPDAPQHGFSLANDHGQPPAVRHFGLSLLEHALRFRWQDYSQEQADTVRGWIIQLARDIDEPDPLYYRNKVALLWIEVAKRSWAAEWTDMDEMLVALWDVTDAKQSVYRQLVLYILEILSEDICIREDAVAVFRQEALGLALNDIMIPQGIYQGQLDARGGKQHSVRFSQEGWLAKVATLVAACCASLSQGDPRAATLAIKGLEALKPTTVWISLRCLLDANIIDALYAVMATGNVAAQMVTTRLYNIINMELRRYRRQLKFSNLFSSALIIRTSRTRGARLCDSHCSVTE